MDSAVMIMGLIELLAALLVWAALSWILFKLFWEAFENPFLGVRGAYLVTGAGFLAYLCFSVYPRYLERLVGAQFTSARWIVAGAALLFFILLCALTYHGMPEQESEEDENV